MAARMLATTLMMLMALFTVHATRADSTLKLHGSRDVSNVTIQVKDGMARIALAGQPYYVLYDSARNTGILVDSASREYREIDPGTLDMYTELAVNMREKMQDRLQLLPPAQRAMLEEQLGGNLGLVPDILPDLDGLHTRTRGMRRVSGFRCQAHLLMQDRQPVGEVCLATAADAGMSSADFATMMAMMDFVRHLAGSAQKLAGNMSESTRVLMSGLKGVPVAVKDYRNKQRYMVRNLSSGKLDSKLFTAYKDYKKQDLLTLLSMVL